MRVSSAYSAYLIQSYKNNTKLFLSFLLVAIGVAVSLRNQGLYAVVFSDEYTYSRFSRLSSSAGATVPSYLFFLIYRYTSYCGDGFLACARQLNAIFFILAAPFIFSISSKVVNPPLSAFIAILSILYPINTYTAYYMPESLYFLTFWIFSWSALNIDYNSRYYRVICCAFIFALMSLVKPHSLFFLPGIVLYLAFLVRQRQQQAWFAKWLWISTIFVGVAITTKLTLGFAMAGAAGATLFGSTYGSYASGASADYIDLIKLAGFSLAGHCLALSVLFGAPLAATLFSARKVLSRNEAENASLSVALYALVIFSSLVPVVALFTASVANMHLDSPFRLHMRYYNFALPLLLIVATSQISAKEKADSKLLSLILSGPFAMATIYAFITKFQPFTQSLIDNPELRVITYNTVVFYIVNTLGLLSIIVWICDNKVGSRIFIFIFSPAVVIFGSYYSSLELRNRLHPDVFDKAGIFAHQYLEGDDASRLVVMGSNPAGLSRSLFYIDDPQASMVQIAAGSPADLSKISDDKEWLLLIGGHAPPSNSRFKLDLNGFSLFRIAGPDRINFARRPWPENVARAQGLSSAEAWGTWSEGPAVTLEFVKPLPKKLILRLTARAFGPNVGQNFTVHMGSQSAQFVLSGSPREIAIPLQNPEASASISFSVPSPASPKELGLGEDIRKLGIAFYQLSLQDVTQ